MQLHNNNVPRMHTVKEKLFQVLISRTFVIKVYYFTRRSNLSKMQFAKCLQLERDTSFRETLKNDISAIHQMSHLIIQGDKKSTQQVNYGKTTHFISKYSCWSPQGIRGDLDFSYAYHFFTSTCAQWANFFFQGRKFEIDLRVKQKQIEFLFSSKST